MQEKFSNADRREGTRRALLGAARELFGAAGYAATATPDLVKRAAVTRGALYHHFANKEAIFEAVIEAEAAQIAAEVAVESSDGGTPLANLQAGAKVYFEVMRRPGRVRLMLLDGPAVLGPETMRQIDLRTGGLELRRGIAEALGPRAKDNDAVAMADLLSAMFERAVLAADGGADSKSYEQAITRLLELLIKYHPDEQTAGDRQDS
ncbi:TetR/AcrR family transcriptional regulator [Paracoccus tegillarcae]|uniref:TetR family transcriptional regulator n=1 Tax=Paracoccus tegillarcae TaxID=1529068 RepID=A0A2K9EMW5_9RHOB|nr:TetR/AcrR family transcriptional regulator [Paracoccus tegillarcae]AUH32036.1 TetR family transcriptional regulator [Paracoccus tegillarcae]